MTEMPPDEQLRRLLARHDRLLAETAQQNRDLHEWAVRYGPRSVAPTAQPGVSAPIPSFSPGASVPGLPDSSPGRAAPPVPAWALPVPAPSFPPPTAPAPARPMRTLSTTQVVARVLGTGGVPTT